MRRILKELGADLPNAVLYVQREELKAIESSGKTGTDAHKSAQDAGSGPTPGNTGQTVGTVGSTNAEHPPTSTMNRVTGDVAASSQDAQKQMQGQPTAVQQGQGVQSSGKTADQDC